MAVTAYVIASVARALKLSRRKNDFRRAHALCAEQMSDNHHLVRQCISSVGVTGKVCDLSQRQRPAFPIADDKVRNIVIFFLYRNLSSSKEACNKEPANVWGTRLGAREAGLL